MRPRTRFAEQFVLAGLTAEHVALAMRIDQMLGEIWDAIETIEAVRRRNAAVAEFSANTSAPIGPLH